MPSTVIAAIQYDIEKLKLRITYVSSAIYDYKIVPEEIYIGLKTSRSKGIFLNQHIKENYKFDKIK